MNFVGRHIIPILSSDKDSLSIFKTRVSLVNIVPEILSSCSKIYDMQGPNTISVSVRNLQRFYQIQINVNGC